MKKTVAATLFVGLLAQPLVAAAPPYTSEAPIAYLKDLSSGAVLYDKGGETRMPPASMAKMMTAHVAFRLIQKGELKLDTKFTVRPETWQQWHGPKAGSTMFLSVGEQVSVENLLHGIVTLSGNDACVVLAEGIAGTEQAFVALMNEEAKRMGLKNSHFGTSNGWPDEGVTYVTAEDLAKLAEATIVETPDLYKKFYAILFQRRQFGIIGMSARLDQAPDRMAFGNGKPLALDLRTGRIGQQAHRHGAGKAGLADAARAAQDPAMMHAAAARCRQQGLRLGVMPDQ